jgi:group I intron endonuclease
MVYGIIYKLTHRDSGRVYIGQTKKTIRGRLSGHKYAAFVAKKDTYICKAIRKYGLDAFDAEQIDDANSLDDLNKLEEHYISLFNSTDRNCGFNIDPSPTKHPDRSTLMSKRMRKVWEDPEYRDRQSASRRGIKRDQKWKESHSRAASKMWQDENHRKTISEKASKYWKENYNPETLRKATESNKKKLAIKAADRVERINQLCTTHKTITSMANELSITMQALAAFLKGQNIYEDIKKRISENK